MTEPAPGSAGAAVAPAAAPGAIALPVHRQLPALVVPHGTLVQQLVDAEVAAVPGCAPWFRGVTRHGSQIVPVLDVGVWAGLQPDALAQQLIYLESEGRRFALRGTGSPRVIDPRLEVPTPWPGMEGFLPALAQGGALVQFHPAQWLLAAGNDIQAAAA